MAAFEPVQRLVALHECFLSGVLCLIGVAQHEVGRPEGGFLVAADQLLEGAGVAGLSGGDECLVLQMTASR